MASKSQLSKRRGGVLPKMDVAIQFLSGAKDACGVAPAQIALGAAFALLTMIRVRSLPFLDKELPIDVRSGHRGQTGLYGHRTILR